jgi:outer membrane receptor protein involved in Fe transport
MKTTKLGLALVLAIVWGASLAAGEGVPGAATVTVNIEAQPMEAALNAFASQTGLQLLFHVEEIITPEMRADRVVGTLPAAEALKKLLNDSGLRFEFINARTVAVRDSKTGEGPAKKVTSAAHEARGGPVLLAQASSENKSAPEQQAGSAEAGLQEVVVTGTHIRGASASASPLIQFNRADIARSGVSTIAQFMRILPQNFNGLSEGSGRLTSRTDQVNLSQGSGVNLRGLGSGSTLVLLNGRRLAPTGEGTYVDVSMIPLAVVERVDVLPDGASAIYGSDAVGGVVNFILRQDYEGAETEARYGFATRGGLSEAQIGQTLGTRWNEGSAMLTYEYFQQQPLAARDRDFSKEAGVTHLFQLSPNQNRHSVFLSAGQRLSDALRMTGSAFFSNRRSEIVDDLFDMALTERNDVNQYGVNAGVELALGSTWSGELVGTYSRNTLDSDVLRDSQAGFVPNFGSTLTSWVADAKADGPVFPLPGGEAKLAVGGQFRRELKSENQDPASGGSAEFDDDRNVDALFTELLLPFVGSGNASSGLQRLELTLAARYEHYGDFGSSTDPKVAALWSPVQGLNVRATYGTSFRAPLFTELSERTPQGFLIFLPDPSSPSLETLAVLRRGGNAELIPEEATTWTAGVDWSPSASPALKLATTYFNIEYENRITRVLALFSAFTDSRYRPLLDLNPDPALLSFLGGQTFSQNFAPGFEFTDAQAIVDERERNNGRTSVQGLDFSATYILARGATSWNLGLQSTYLLKYDEQIVSGDVLNDVLNTFNNPVRLRARGNLGWGYGGLSLTLAGNYLDHYEDNRAVPTVGVAAWFTTDIDLRYEHNNVVLALSALNLFDRDPPFALGVFGNNVNYDPNNANAAGRTVAVQGTYRW